MTWRPTQKGTLLGTISRSRVRAFLSPALLAPSLLVVVTGSCPALDLSVKVALGPDTGQSFGTLFECSNAEGKRICGSGFVSAYNTRYRHDRLQLQFYARPPGPVPATTLRPLPRPTSDSGAYLFLRQGEVFGQGRDRDPELRSWQEQSQTWETVEDPGITDHCLVRGKVLGLRDGAIMFDGREILPPPATGKFLRLYFAQDHLFFFHQDTAEDSPLNRIHAVPWSPYRPEGADFASSRWIDTKYFRSFPYSYGQLGQNVITCTNKGGIYEFSGSRWRTLVEASDRTSYQVYSMIQYRDRILLGHYPTGRLLEYDGSRVSERPDWPPCPLEVSPRAREAQTAIIHGGQLVAGIWPWSELWRLHYEDSHWSLLGRACSLPPFSNLTLHPYEEIAEAAGWERNALGQRVHFVDSLERSPLGWHLLQAWFRLE